GRARRTEDGARAVARAAAEDAARRPAEPAHRLGRERPFVAARSAQLAAAAESPAPRGNQQLRHLGDECPSDLGGGAAGGRGAGRCWRGPTRARASAAAADAADFGAGGGGPP